MFRIWGRIEREHKIVRQTTYEPQFSQPRI